jgi:hypothetical protein
VRILCFEKQFAFLRKSKLKATNVHKLALSQKKQIVILALKAHILTPKNVVK